MSSLIMLIGNASSSIDTGAFNACGGFTGVCNGSSVPQVFASLANTLTFLVGAVSVIMIIIGGLRYVLSNGDSKAVTAAKDTILYAIIGVVVALVAYAVVHFVTANIK
jgi:hypothetical protein